MAEKASGIFVATDQVGLPESRPFEASLTILLAKPAAGVIAKLDGVAAGAMRVEQHAADGTPRVHLLEVRGDVPTADRSGVASSSITVPGLGDEATVRFQPR